MSRGPKVFLHLSYLGTKYRGWQRQNNVLSVQQVLEDNLSDMLGEPITVYGCGRTDAGVHASQYIAHIHTNDKWEEIPDPRFRLNKMLPQDISVLDVIPVPEEAHARYTAKSRTYDFFAHTSHDALINPTSTLYLSDELNWPLMASACELLSRQSDFRNLCRKPEIHDSTICAIEQVNLYRNASGTRVRLQITANRFLRCMMRLTMERVMQVGLGNETLEELERILQSKNHDSQLKAAHPQGLFLSGITYDYVQIPPISDVHGIYLPKDQSPWILAQ